MKTVSLIFLCAAFFSCGFFNEDNEPAYRAKIAWDSGLYSNMHDAHTVDGDSVFFYERPPKYDHVNIYTLTRLDARTGSLVWRSSLFSNILRCQPVAVDNYIYVFTGRDTMLSFDRETGGHKATARLRHDGGKLELNYNVAAYRQYIYISFQAGSGYSSYFGRVDVNTISQNEDPQNIQIISPEVIWQPDTVNPVHAKPVIYKNIIYTGTRIVLYPPDEPVELAGFNIDTKEMVFHAVFGGAEDMGKRIRFPETGPGLRGNPILIHNDILYYLSWSLNAWDLNTGEKLYRHVFTNDVPIPQLHYNKTCLQQLYHNGNIYYTSGSGNNGWRQLHCINAETGKLVWNTVPEDIRESIVTNPIIADGKIYLAYYYGLFVYDTKDGKLLGVDRNFCGAGMGRNILYNDLMICVRKNRDTGRNSLVAVDLK